MTISGTYNPTNNSVALTVTGGPSGTLVVYKQSTSLLVDDSPRVVVVDTVPGYSGSANVTDWLPPNKNITYSRLRRRRGERVRRRRHALVGFTGVWLMHLSDPAIRLQVKIARERRDSWRARERRGWTGDVIGETRTVGVSDVAMSGRRGRFDILTDHRHRARGRRQHPAQRHRVRPRMQHEPLPRRVSPHRPHDRRARRRSRRPLRGRLDPHMAGRVPRHTPGRRTVRPHPAAADDLINGSFQYRTRVVLDSVNVAGDAVTADVVEGTYRESMSGVPQVQLEALLYADDTPQLPDLLECTDVRVRVTAQVRAYGDADWTSIPLTPLWLEQVTYETTSAGRAVRIEAVCILGRLSNNQLTRPVQTSGTAKAGISTLLNNAGHTQTVTVAGGDGPGMDGDVYDGDPSAGAVEIADHAGSLIRVDDENSVTIVASPASPPTRT